MPGRLGERLAALVDPLAKFHETYESIGEYPSLVVLFRPPEADPAVADEPSAEAYKRQFWGVLEYLQDHDPEPWPASVLTDPEHPKCQYCFAGEPTFLVGRALFYERRRSRFTPHGLEITVQPWGVFGGTDRTRRRGAGGSDADQGPPGGVRRRRDAPRRGRLHRPADPGVEAVHAPGDERGERGSVSAARADRRRGESARARVTATVMVANLRDRGPWDRGLWILGRRPEAACSRNRHAVRASHSSRGGPLSARV
ncbi:hypothetical protein C481_03427 [Natrialba asiatica DSM 12278]|uniref:Uncharacterized protein n=1 Tax=Natrialba asiatica (strain ATCC 700177 / DSM 12278 / JCM 9576 / FERM P-10747 / NBRC 102637 / 172P1) TaxID=29540 RepID=M0B3Z9_NATA1|nr:hypothetical protein C481_03427 [Natrialba asiatica DSM 12278]